MGTPYRHGAMYDVDAFIDFEDDVFSGSDNSDDEFDDMLLLICPTVKEDPKSKKSKTPLWDARKSRKAQARKDKLEARLMQARVTLEDHFSEKLARSPSLASCFVEK